MKILIVEDEYTSRRLMEQHLSAYGECQTVGDGTGALKAYKEARAENDPYDLIALDIMLPDIDGYAVLEEIREIEHKEGLFGNDSTKVIMTTALADPKHIMRAFNDQCEAYLIKPIRKEHIDQALLELNLI